MKYFHLIKRWYVQVALSIWGLLILWPIVAIFGGFDRGPNWLPWAVLLNWYIALIWTFYCVPYFGLNYNVLPDFGLPASTYRRRLLMSYLSGLLLIALFPLGAVAAYVYNLRNGLAVLGWNSQFISVLIATIFFLALAGVGVVFFVFGCKRTDRLFMLRQICCKCGYNLYGAVSETCTECGAPVLHPKANHRP